MLLPRCGRWRAGGGLRAIIAWLAALAVLAALTAPAAARAAEPAPAPAPPRFLRRQPDVLTTAVLHGAAARRGVASHAQRELTVRLGGVDATLVLRPDRALQRRGVNAFAVGDNGTRTPLALPLHEFYTGHVRGWPASVATARLLPDGRLLALVTLDPLHTYAIEVEGRAGLTPFDLLPLTTSVPSFPASAVSPSPTSPE